MSFTDGKPRIATEEDMRMPWNCKPNGEGFLCKLCGHKFQVGDYWRFVYANGTPGQGTGNFWVCKECDKPDALQRAKEQRKIADRWS